MNEKIGWSSFVSAGDSARYLADAFSSGWVSGGPYVEKLEDLLNSIFQGSRSFTVSNGTSALQLAFQTLNVKPGDEVVVPAFCFQAAANILHQLGAIPIFCDVNPDTWNQDVKTIQNVISEKTVGIVVVHNYGRAAPIEEIVKLANEGNLWVIEDCAEAWFSSSGGKYLGQFGAIGTFSMHATKTISCGEGGVVLINDHTLIEKVKLLRSHGLNRDKTHYLHELPGNNYRLSNLLCAVSLGQLEQYKSISEKQINRMHYYQNRLSDHWGLALQCGNLVGDDKIWAIAVRIKSHLLSVTREKLMDLLKLRGVDTRPGFCPASSLEYNHPFVGKYGYPVAEFIAKDIIVLPCGQDLTQTQISYVCDVLIDLLDHHRNQDLDCVFEDLVRSSGTQFIIEELTSRLGCGAETFRYFQTRSYDVIRTHDISIGMRINGKLAGYAHVEEEKNIYWVGIAIVESGNGMGWGKILLSELLFRAYNIGIFDLHLRVDRSNISAVRLYLLFGFNFVPSLSDEKSLHMHLNIQGLNGLFQNPAER
jgi:perosamine synthetase